MDKNKKLKKCKIIKKPIILQQYFDAQINNGGPATGAILLMNSDLKNKFHFISMNKTFPFHGLSLKQFFYFYKIIKSVKPDIIHIRGVQSVGFFGVLAAKLLRYKVVLSIHGLSIDLEGNSKIKSILYNNIFEKYALQKADLVYCVCKYASNRSFIKKNTKNLYGYIHNAAPEFDNVFNIRLRMENRLKFQIKDNDIVVTTISRITREKGFDVLTKSIPDILDRNSNIRFIIAGDGDYLPTLELQLKKYILTNKVSLLGKISNVNDVLLASDIFIFPTYHENLSNSLLEASACGLPIIATNVGGNPEIVLDKVTGILIESHNVNDLIETVLTLANDKELRIEYGQNALQHIKDNFNQKEIFNEMSLMYNSLL